MAATLAMSPRHFSSTIRLGLQHLPPRLIRQLPPRFRPEIPPRLRNKLERHPNRPEPSAEPVIEDDVILAARKMDLGSVLILKRGQQVTHEKEPRQAVEGDHQQEVNEEPKTTTAEDFPKAAEGDQQNEAKEEEADRITDVAATTVADNLHKINVETKTATTVTTTTTAAPEDLPNAAEDDQHEVKEQEPNQISAEDDDDHVDEKEDEGVKKEDRKGLWDHYFTTIAPALMPPPPTALPLPTLLLRKPPVN